MRLSAMSSAMVSKLLFRISSRKGSKLLRMGSTIIAERKIDQNITMGIACHRRIRWHHHRALVLLDDQWPAARRLAEAASGHHRRRQHTPGRTKISHALAIDARRARSEGRYPTRAIGRKAADKTQVHDLVRVLPRKAMAIAP